jgi:hypothetical protein
MDIANPIVKDSHATPGSEKTILRRPISEDNRGERLPIRINVNRGDV